METLTLLAASFLFGMKLETTLSIGFLLLASGCVNEQATTVTMPYHYPLTSPGEKFVALPPPVQKAIRAQAGAAEITTIDKHLQDSFAYYRVQFSNEKALPPLLISSQGNVLNEDLTVAIGVEEEKPDRLSGTSPANPSLSEL